MGTGTKRGAIAHTREDGATHALEAHLYETGRRAAAFGTAFEAEAVAELTGRWHDLGKYHPAFQAKLEGALNSALNDEDAAAHDAASQRVDHSSAGALLAARMGSCVSSAMAFAIAGHHAGLADLAALQERLQAKAALLGESLKGGVPPALLQHAPLPEPRALVGRPNNPDDQRPLEFWTRMLFSALCDADFLDTEAFMHPGTEALRQRPVTLDALGDALRSYLDGLQARANDTEVNRVRREGRQACEARAHDPPGRFTLTVPTGGGKTLAAMAFALEHARRHGLQRVVVAVPYTAILEQNAAVYRAVFAAFGDDAVVEHHSALDPNRETWRNKLASENWDAPIVVTTTVQLFESLFARRSSRCRKLHRLARAVIVLDEAQSLPPELLPTILDGIRELTDHYGATVVSCTATQPALDHHPRRLPCGLTAMREIVPSDLRAFERLRRVRLEMPHPDAPPTPWEDLAAQLAAEPDALAIVHRRTDARTLCEALDAVLGNTESIHLSALMCPAHRTEVLDAMKARKRRKEPVRVVSTQLVEAGVDVDFARVFRALAGFDAIAQAAGRCNREGTLADLGHMTVFRALSAPPKGLLSTGLAEAIALLRECPDLDVLSPQAQRLYFQRLYRILRVEADPRGVEAARKQLKFETTARLFTMIDDEWAAPVVVPWGPQGKALIEQGHQEAAGPGLSRRLLRQMQRYTVSVSRRDHDAMLRRGELVRIDDTISVLPNVFAHRYSPRFGLELAQTADGVAEIASLIVDGSV